jgi:hypothetical protein
MTQLNLEKTLRGQLQVLNDIIDRKIVRGMPYGSEAKQHKYILKRLESLKRDRMSWNFRSLTLA